ncbi:conjugal transfer protein TraH [Thiotrichales bacterium 19S11-10]|nr:conjugal transfer protein TraH [Thiotrichales bacterium 19S11-10]
MSKLFKSLTVILLCIGSHDLFASLASSLNDYANDIGYANITGASASMMQEGGYLSGGSGYIATPVKNLQLARVQLPSLNAGCGGIDMTFGGLSFISSDQLTEFGQAIIQDAVPFAVDLALQTWAPSIKSAKDTLVGIANQINDFNMSSCQASQLAVGSVSGWFMDEEGKQFICQSYKTQHNQVSDWLSTHQGCVSNSGSANRSAKNDPELKDMVKEDRNIVWYQFMKNEFLKTNPEVAEYLMSMTGTIIYPESNGGSTAPDRYAPLIIDSKSAGFQEMLYGSNDSTKVKVYECDTKTEDGCKKPKVVTLHVDKSKAMVNKVRLLLEDIGARFVSNEIMTSEEESLLGAVDFPVAMILQNEIRAGWVPQYQAYADIISRIILASYISQILNEARASIAKNESSSGDKDFKQVIHNLENAQTIVLGNYESHAYEALKQKSEMILRSVQVQGMVVGDLSGQSKQNFSFQGV